MTYTSSDRELRSDAADLVAAIDAGAGAVQQKLDSFLSGAWSRTARGVAAGTKKASALKEVLALETSLGMNPVDDPDPVPEAAEVSEPVPAAAGYGY
ncbi:MAG: hypothetical protein H6523_12900 [Mycolicibacterium sp.]|nr:hypothetical protein [Mycolicibacterium sp.]